MVSYSKQKISYVVYFIVASFTITQLSYVAISVYLTWKQLPYTLFSGLSLMINLIFAAYTIRYYVYGFFSSLKKQQGSYINDEQKSDNSFVSIILPIYNESKVIDRLLLACTNFENENYEIIVADDSTDSSCLVKLEKWKEHYRVKVIHRNGREGAKAGALNKGLKYVDPRSTHILIFDADFIPPRDIIPRMLRHFTDKKIAAVQGYQQHILNADQNWITKTTRLLWCTSCMIDLAGRAQIGSMLQLTGSVMMVRTDVLKKLKWTHCLTEDWDLTLRLYLNGYEIYYDENLKVPAECVSRIQDLARQQMRWAMGHVAGVRKYFSDVLTSPHLDLRKKVEFLFLSFFYFQAPIILLGHINFIIAIILKSTLELSFLISCLMYFVISCQVLGLLGLHRENTLKQTPWILYATISSYIMLPIVSYAALKGLILPKRYSHFFKTPKTGEITYHNDL